MACTLERTNGNLLIVSILIATKSHWCCWEPPQTETLKGTNSHLHFEALANGTITEKIIDDLRAPKDANAARSHVISCALTTNSISWSAMAPTQQYHAPSDVHGPIASGGRLTRSIARLPSFPWRRGAAMEGHSVPRYCSSVPCTVGNPRSEQN